MVRHIPLMVVRALLFLLAIAVSGTPAVARTRPSLAVDVAMLIDDGVTLTEAPQGGITEPVASPPVSLSDATHGLVSGGVPDDERRVAVELERAYRATTVTGDQRPRNPR